MTIFSFDLQVWTWHSTYQTNVSNDTSTYQGQQLCWITCILKSINVQLMAWTSSVYDHFIIWPSSVTLTFNLTEQMFQMALLLLKHTNCASLFWNPCINVQVMAWTSSIYDHFIVWPSSVTLTFNLPEQMFQMSFVLLKDNNCAKLFWNPCRNVQVMVWTNPDACMHAHTPNRNCNNYVSLTARGLNKNCRFFNNISIIFLIIFTLNIVWQPTPNISQSFLLQCISDVCKQWHHL